MKPEKISVQDDVNFKYTTEYFVSFYIVFL